MTSRVNQSSSLIQTNIMTIALIILGFQYCYSYRLTATPSDEVILFSQKEIATITTNYSSISVYVRKAGDYIFIGLIEGKLNIIDIRNKQQPRVVAEINISDIFQTFTITTTPDEKILFVACQVGGIYIYNITDPEHVSLINSTTLPYNNFAAKVQILKGNIMALVSANSGIIALFIQDIFHPTVVGFTPIAAIQFFDIVLTQNEEFAYVCAEQAGVAVLDLRNIYTTAPPITFPVVAQIDTAIYANLRIRLSADEKTLFVLDIYYGLLVVDVSNIKKKNFTEPLTIIGSYFLNGFMYGMALSSDSNTLMITFRTKGIQIFDASNIYNIKPMQFLKQKGHCYDVQLSNDQQYLFYANALGVVIYQKTQPNFNKNFPSMFNAFQSFIIPKPHESVPWQISVRKEGQSTIAYVAYDFDGIIIYNFTDIDRTYILSQFNAVDQQEVARFWLSKKNSSIIYVADSYTGFFAADISNFSNPIIYPSGAENIAPGSDIDDIKPINAAEDMFVTAIGMKGAAIFKFNRNSSGGFEESSLVSLISVFGNTNIISVSCDKKIVFVVARENGLNFVDISNMSNPKIIALIPSSGNEDVVVSKDCNYLYFAEGYRGLTILNITNPAKPQRIISLGLGGWTTNLAIMKDDKFAFAAQQDTDEIVLINIEDKHNPYIIQKFNPIGEDANYVQISQDEDRLYICTTNGIRILPLTPDITLQTIYFLEGQVTPLPVGTTLKIGQTIDVWFEPIYDPLLIKIVEFFYYQNYKLQNLPDWMKFSQSDSQLKIMVSKFGQGMNLIVAKTFKYVNEKDFIDPTINLTETDSQLIRALAQSRGYLTENFFLTESFNVEDVIVLNHQIYDEPQVAKKIKLILVRKMNYIPIQFYIENSLFFFYNQTKVNIIQTFSTSNCKIVIHLQNLNDGKFVKKSFESVFVIFSDSQDQISMSGPLEIVNKQIYNIEFAPNQDNNLNEPINSSVIVDDQQNFPLELKIISLQQMKFIYYNQVVKKGFSLQSQFNSIYSSGSVYIEEQFAFQFNQETFQDEDELTYTAFILLDDNKWEELKQDESTWIKFFGKDRKFSGMPKQEHFMEEYTIRIVASDGYTAAEDTFTMKLSKVPFLFVLSYIIAVGAPIVGAFGIVSYRFQIHAFLFKKKYRYSTIFMKAGEPIDIRIPLNYSKIVQGQNIVKQLEIVRTAEIKKKKLQKETWIDIFVNENHQVIKEHELLVYIYQNIDKKLKLFELHEVTDQQTDTSKTIIYLMWRKLLEKDSKTKRFYEKLRKKAIIDGQSEIDYYKVYLDIFYRKEITDDKIDKAQYVYPVLHFRYDDLFDTINSIAGDKKPKIQYQDKYKPSIQEKDQTSIEQEEYLMQQCFSAVYPQINFYLLINIIRADALGICQYKFFSFSQGESIHHNEASIYSVRGMRKRVGWCLSIYNFLNQDYVNIEMTENSPLPAWLNCIIKYRAIHIQGTPSDKDTGELLIRITNSMGLIVRDFSLVIEETFEQQQKKLNFSQQFMAVIDVVKKFKNVGKKKSLMINNLVRSSTQKKLQKSVNLDNSHQKQQDSLTNIQEQFGEEPSCNSLKNMAISALQSMRKSEVFDKNKGNSDSVEKSQQITKFNHHKNSDYTISVNIDQSNREYELTKKMPSQIESLANAEIGSINILINKESSDNKNLFQNINSAYPISEEIDNNELKE